MVKAKVFILQKPFEGFPKEDDVKIVEEDLRPIKNGEFLVEAVYFGIHPGIRYFDSLLKTGDTCAGDQVAKIIESKNPRYPIGQYVVGFFGWRTHTIADGSLVLFAKPLLVPNFGDLPLSLALSVLGMPGNTAYFGFLELCTPKVGETVVVTTAAGAVGSYVGQIAKIKGCKVVGVTGSDEKGKWLIEELGFDHFINYKTADLDKALTEAAPEGIDCYFDNVGGDMASIILRHMNDFGRVSVCGAVSSYNDKEPTKALIVQGPLISFNLKMEGFVAYRWLNRWNEGIQQNLKWIKEGKLKYKETIIDGFENMFKTFVGVLNGENIGRVIIKV